MIFSLADILHAVGQSLLVPCLIILIGLILVTIWQIGDILVESFIERRKLRTNIPALLKSIHANGVENIETLIGKSQLLKRQKQALYTLLEAKDMPRDSMVALAQRLLATEEASYDRDVAITDMVARLGPMFGLLGTLIPLGPGIVALGQGDTAQLSKSLGMAFDTTIAGLASASVCSVISKIRKRWYSDYMVTLESIMELILEGIAADRENKFKKRANACGADNYYYIEKGVI
ncbi:MAG: MotA/TolQ/ExbB proton channel family protein [Dehalobacterium sp.]